MLYTNYYIISFEYRKVARDLAILSFFTILIKLLTVTFKYTILRDKNKKTRISYNQYRTRL